MASQFDFYILSVTYVPAFCCHLPHKCLSSPEIVESSALFAAHGVWPSYLNGNKHYPSFCKSPHTHNTQTCTTKMMNGSSRLYKEYLKHGSCTSLKPKEYMLLEHRLMEKVKEPLQDIGKHIYMHTTMRASGASGDNKEKRDKGKEIVIPIHTLQSLFPYNNGNNGNNGNDDNNTSSVVIKTSPYCQLQELRFCFDKKEQPMSCPAYLQTLANTGSCSSVVMEPPASIEGGSNGTSNQENASKRECEYISKTLLKSVKHSA